MSQLDDLEITVWKDEFTHIRADLTYESKQAIKALMLDLIGDMEQRETEDMSLKSWTSDDYKAFGKNELRNEIRRKVSDL